MTYNHIKLCVNVDEFSISIDYRKSRDSAIDKLSEGLDDGGRVMGNLVSYILPKFCKRKYNYACYLDIAVGTNLKFLYGFVKVGWLG